MAWQSNTIGELFRPLKSSPFTRDELNYSGGKFRNVHYGDILIKFPSVIDVEKDDLPYINEVSESKCGRCTLLQDGDVIIADTAEDEVVGKAIEIHGTSGWNVVSGLHTIAYRPQEGIFAPGFLGYFLNSTVYHNQLIPLMQGIKVLSISRSALADTVIKYPSYEEQLCITRALSAVDALIAELDEAIEKKRKIQKGIMQQLLTGNTRLPGFSGEWVNASLGQLFDFYKGNGLSKEDIEATGTNRCVLYGEIFTKYDIDTSDGYSLTDSAEGFPSMRGDILMPGSTTTTGIDLVKAIVVLDDGVQLGGDVIVMRKEEDVDPHFIAMVISNITRQAVAEKAQGTTIIHLHGKNLTNICYSIPTSKKEQEAISQLIMQQDAEIKAIAAKRNKYSLIKQGMMQELLTGKTRLI